MNYSTELQNELLSLKNPTKAQANQRFFKTGKGEYGENDEFYGISYCDMRNTAKKFAQIPLEELQKHLNSKIHEERQCTLFILVHKYQNKKTTTEEKRKIYDFYLKNTKNINNWDLVDLSAHKITGAYILEHPEEKNILYTLAKSQNIWEKRIAIISTYTFIKQNQFTDTFNISEILLTDKHDLIHKAVGWMMREVGKINMEEEEKFLKKHYKKMPRTMLRYAIEKFPEKVRQAYLKGNI